MLLNTIWEYAGFLYQEVLLVSAGWISSRLQNAYRKYIRQNAFRRFFGDSSPDSDGFAIVIPLFQPLSYDDFSADETTHVRKSTSVLHSDNTAIVLPMYSDVIVADDYRAYEFVNSVAVGYLDRAIAFMPDNTRAQDEQSECCFACIGGPRSNLVLKEVMDLKSTQTFVTLDHASGGLDT